MKQAIYMRVCAGNYNGESFTVFSEEEAVLAALIASRLVDILNIRRQEEDPIEAGELLQNIALERADLHWVPETIYNLA